jgi:hypothetical protein
MSTEMFTAALAEMKRATDAAPRPEVDLVLLTRLVPPGQCLIVPARRWLLAHPADMALLRAESRKDPLHLPGALFGLRIEDVAPGSPREHEILFVLGNAIRENLARAHPLNALDSRGKTDHPTDLDLPTTIGEPEPLT